MGGGAAWYCFANHRVLLEERQMNHRNDINLLSMTLVAFVVLGFAMVPPAQAQEEPTPVPEPDQEEPAAPEPTPVAAPEEPAEPEPQEAKVPMVYREKTLVTINGRAQMNGFIELVVIPNGEKPTKVRANIIAKTKTKKITKELTSQLVFALGDRYKVKQTGDKTIRVSAKKKMPPLAITLMTQNLAGVSVMIGQG